MSRVAEDTPERSIPPHQTRSTIARPSPDPVFFMSLPPFLKPLRGLLPPSLLRLVAREVLQPRGIDLLRLALLLFRPQPIAPLVSRRGSLLGEPVDVAVLAVLGLEPRRLCLLLDVERRRGDAGEEHPARPREHRGRDPKLWRR